MLQSVRAAQEAFSTWSSYTTARERGEILQSWHHIMMEKEDELAELITLEQVYDLNILFLSLHMRSSSVLECFLLKNVG